MITRTLELPERTERRIQLASAAFRLSGDGFIKAAIDAGELFWAHAFEYACAQCEIDSAKRQALDGQPSGLGHHCDW